MNIVVVLSPCICYVIRESYNAIILINIQFSIIYTVLDSIRVCMRGCSCSCVLTYVSMCATVQGNVTFVIGTIYLKPIIIMPIIKCIIIRLFL